MLLDLYRLTNEAIDAHIPSPSVGLQGAAHGKNGA
jgi:hypothetical protein